MFVIANIKVDTTTFGWGFVVAKSSNINMMNVRPEGTQKGYPSGIYKTYLLSESHNQDYERPTDKLYLKSSESGYYLLMVNKLKTLVCYWSVSYRGLTC